MPDPIAPVRDIGTVKDVHGYVIRVGVDHDAVTIGGAAYAMLGPGARDDFMKLLMQADTEAKAHACAACAPAQAEDYRCPDCGRASCTGEDCYWPDEAGIARIEHAIATAIKEHNFPMVVDLLKLLALKDPERARIVYDVLVMATSGSFR